MVYLSIMLSLSYICSQHTTARIPYEDRQSSVNMQLLYMILHNAGKSNHVPSHAKSHRLVLIYSLTFLQSCDKVDLWVSVLFYELIGSIPFSLAADPGKKIKKP